MTPPRTPAEMREQAAQYIAGIGLALTRTEEATVRRSNFDEWAAAIRALPLPEDPERSALEAVAKAAEEYRKAVYQGRACDEYGPALDAALAQWRALGKEGPRVE